MMKKIISIIEENTGDERMISEIQIEPIKYKVDNQHVNILLNKLVDGEAI